MTRKLVLIALLALNATGASAQVADISGRYLCVQQCKGVGPAYIAQADNLFDFNLVNEAGETARAWIDFPGHLWIERWNEGAFLALDGVTIKFVNGTVWKRYDEWDRALDTIPPVPSSPRQR